MQVARLAPATMATARTRAAWGFTELERAHQVIKALAKELVNLSHNAAQFGPVKVAFHHVDDVLNQ